MKTDDYLTGLRSRDTLPGDFRRNGAMMGGKDRAKSQDYLSTDDMRRWLDQEIRDATKAFELRIREATGLVSAYAAGKLTPEQADEHHAKYYQRWGEALPGISASDTLTDADIVAAIDGAGASAEANSSYVKRLGGAFRRSRRSSR